jgi:dihydrofolate synthase/folylpolyglutamate synthase
MTNRTLADWLVWQESLHPSEIELGLDRVREVFNRLDIHKPFTITVAGTNGKGTCARAVEAILARAGYRTGCYTSPHLDRYNERITINGEQIADNELVRIFERVDIARGDVPLTYFEFGTLAAIQFFSDSAVDYQVLEVGLGGRLDAVNLVDPDIAIITNIALDHQQWLGEDRESIAREKAGILRPGIPVLVGERQELWPDSLGEIISGLKGNEIYVSGREFTTAEEKSGQWSWLGGDVTIGGLPMTSLPMPSLTLAIQASLLADPGVREVIPEVLHELKVPGRREMFTLGGVNILMDVGHNPAASEFLSGYMRSTWKGAYKAVFSALADKDIPGIVQPFFDTVDQWYLSELETDRAASIKDLEDSLSGARGNTAVFDTIGSAMQQAVEDSQEGDLVLVFGSFFTVAEAREWIRHRQIV